MPLHASRGQNIPAVRVPIRVLCVDDEPTIREVLSYCLRERYEVVVAASGAEGLTALEEDGPFAVVISDMRMPGMDGAVFLGHIRRLAPDAIRILFTGYHDVDNAVAAVNTGGVFRYLIKPCTTAVVREAVDAAVAQYHHNLRERQQTIDALLSRTREVMVKNQHLECLYKLSRVLDRMAGSGAYVSKDLVEVFRRAVERPNPPCVHIAIEDVSETVGCDDMVVEAVFPVMSGGRERGEVRLGHAPSAPRLQCMQDECSLLREMADRLASHVAALDAQQLVRERQRQLIQADKLASLGVMVAGVAHEVNNPVNNIMLNASLLRDALGDIQPVLDVYFQQHGTRDIGGLPYEEMRTLLPQMIKDMIDSCERIKTITGDLKEASPVDYEKVHATVRVNTSVEQAVRMCGHMDKRFYERVEMTLAEGLPDVACSRRRLEQVVINLLQNAWQALQQPQARLFVETSMEPGGGAVLVVVRDEGPGMPPEVLDRIKDPFFTTRRDKGGTGLGIYIANGIIEDMGGSLSFESQEGNGTVACICLPVNR